MTKKHFEKVAQIIKEIPYDKRAEPCILFANHFEREYPRFKREKFIKACGL